MSILRAIQRIFSRKPKLLIHSLSELEWSYDLRTPYKKEVSILSLGKGYSIKIEDDGGYDKNRYTVWVKCRGVMVLDFPGIDFGFYQCRYEREVVKYVNYIYNQIINEL